jgi:hypothetical protein
MKKVLQSRINWNVSGCPELPASTRNLYSRPTGSGPALPTACFLATGNGTNARHAASRRPLGPSSMQKSRARLPWHHRALDLV